MRDNLYKSVMVISIIFIPILFCCASTQQKQSESRDAEAYYNQGRAYGQKGEYDQAISDFNKAIEVDPGDAAAHNNRAEESRRNRDESSVDRATRKSF